MESPDDHELLLSVSQLSAGFVMFDAALKTAIMCLELMVQAHIEDDYRARVHNCLGNLYVYTGELNKAQECYQRALTCSLSIQGEASQNTAQIYNKIADVYRRQGQLSNALSFCEKSLNIKPGLFQENHPHVAESYNNMVILCCSEGNTEEAVRLFNKALQIRQSTLGPHHIEVSQCYYNLAQFI